MPTSNTAICRWTLLLSSGLSVLLRMKKHALRVGKIDSWSKMQNADTEYYIDTNDKEFYPYDRYVKWIRDYIHDRKWSISPLELEFIIWPIMQKKLAAEGF